MNLPEYHFHGQHFEVRPGIRMHYLDEGPRDGEVIVMLHGNPSWSYYWRRLVNALRGRYRCIVPDHIGMGLSDKPGDEGYAYTLQSRVDDLSALLEHLGVRDNVTLAVHDWGGMIGFGWALSHAAAVKRLIITNTSAFPLPKAKAMPWQLRLGRDSKLGALLIRGFNAFARGAARYGVVHRLNADTAAALCAPYDSWRHRISTLRFVQDIPLSPKDRAWALVEQAGRRLPEFADRPTLICWGLQDFVFDKHFLAGFTAALPDASVHAWEDAGHYVLEDKPAQIVNLVSEFLGKHPLG